MRPSDAALAALENLAQHKLRSILTTLGMMFGVGAVIAMLSIGAGAERQAIDLIDKMGADNVIIRAKDFPENELLEIRKKSTGLSMRDVEAIGEAVPHVEHVAPSVEIDAYKILSHAGKTESSVFGVSSAHPRIVELEVAEGRFFDRRDEAQHAQVIVLGATARRDLFGPAPVLGKSVKVNDVWFEVIGVLAPESTEAANIEGVAIASRARTLFLPVSTALRKFEHRPLESPLAEIVVATAADGHPDQIAAVIDTLLGRLHGDASDYEIVVPAALLEQSQATQRLFDIVMGCIAGISLLVGGIGIMNIMLASVLEQTRAIGICRAVGARRRDIRFQFLVTSFALSALGGSFGVVLGVGISTVVAAYADWPTIVTPWSILLSTGVSVAVGVVSGLYPALRAANLDPIDALRHE